MDNVFHLALCRVSTGLALRKTFSRQLVVGIQLV